MSEPILFLVSRGLLEHKDRMGAAIWEYLWFLDRVTKDEPNGMGKFNGLVLGGKPVSAAEIARELKEHLETAKRNIRILERQGYIARKRLPENRCSYIVSNSKKWFWRRTENVSARGSESASSKQKGIDASKQEGIDRRSESASTTKERQDSNTTKIKTRGAGFDASQVLLPSWVPQDAWLEFVEHRKNLKKPVTELAAKKIFKTLETLRGEGHDPRDVIDQSIADGWTGLFELKRAATSGNGTQPAVEYLNAGGGE